MGNLESWTLVLACHAFLFIKLSHVYQETALPSAWYEVLSVLHMMAMLRLSQANSLLLPKTSLEGYHAKVSEGLQYAFQFHSLLLLKYVTIIFQCS